MLRPLLVALLGLALIPAAASADALSIELLPKRGADFGDSTSITGKLTGLYDAPLVARQVELEVRRYPYTGRFVSVARAMTGLDGRFAFERTFDRNHQVRVFAPEAGNHSPFLAAYVFPRTNLTFSLVRRNVIRLVQTYRTPTTVKLTAPTLFYVGRAGRARAPLAARVKTKPVLRNGKRVKGRFRARTSVRIPAAWKGRFRYASCFPYNGGMGDPKLGCPKRLYKF